MNRRFLSWAVYALLALWPSAAFAVNANPVPGSIWTYFGPTLGADWASSTVFNLGGPPWTTSYGNFDAFRISVNNYPVSGEIAGGQPGQFNAPSALFAGINIPANAISNPAGAGNGVTGMALSASSQLGAVGLYGFGGQTADHVSSWGANPVVTNCPTPACLPNTGFGGSGATMWGTEIDVNVFKEANAAPVGLNVRGIEIVGASETQVGAGGSSFGVNIRPMGANPPIIPWQTGYSTADGAAINGLSLGATLIPPTTAGSQPFCMNAYNGNSTNLASCLINASNGALGINGASLVSLQVQGQTLITVNNMSGGSVNILDLTTTASTSSPALNFTAYSSSAALLVGSIQLVPSTTIGNFVYNAPSGSNIFETNGEITFEAFPSPLSLGGTGIMFEVDNNAGKNLASVTLGAADSGGTGFRVVRVPN